MDPKPKKSSRRRGRPRKQDQLKPEKSISEHKQNRNTKIIYRRRKKIKSEVILPDVQNLKLELENQEPEKNGNQKQERQGQEICFPDSGDSKSDDLNPENQDMEKVKSWISVPGYPYLILEKDSMEVPPIHSLRPLERLNIPGNNFVDLRNAIQRSNSRNKEIPKSDKI